MAEIELKICDIASEQLGIPRLRISPSSSLVEDLGCDSLDIVEMMMTIESEFGVTLPVDSPNPVCKAIFTRQPFRLADLAEMVYVQQDTGLSERNGWGSALVQSKTATVVPFTQLGGCWQRKLVGSASLLERLESTGAIPQYRRRSDGMRCVRLPSAVVEIGCETANGLLDEQPKHNVELDAFLIDAEPVSTTAYCRFLNSIGEVSLESLMEWFVLDPDDDRREHMLVAQTKQGWTPVAGTERWPMILVSWYGANAYSLWANGREWHCYRDESGVGGGSCLPSEAQWEYAARGARYQPFPWGEALPSQDQMRYGQHRRSATYRADTLPLAAVNEQLGMSPFGLHHMAGNVWQWCQDWYDGAFYQRHESTVANPINRTPSRVRSERGGSWVGPAELCRSSYRRGRPPAVRGRCLGFRCISSIKDAS